MNWLIKNFLRGLIIVVPIALTIYLLTSAFVALDRVLRLPTPGLGIAILLLATVAVGALASNFVGREVVRATETLFKKAPIVRIVYAAIKDLLEAFVGNKRRFDRPVAVTLSEGVQVFGFVTREDLSDMAMPGRVGVYIPFSYTWDGCLLVVDRERVQPVTAESANVMAVIVSGGVSG